MRVKARHDASLEIEDSGLEKNETPYYVLPDFDRERVQSKISPYDPTKKLILSGIVAKSGREVLPTAAPDLYPDLEVVLK